MSAAPSWTFPFGATYLGNDRTRFRLWAPNQKNVSVEFDRRTPLIMERQADGWFEAETACESGATYIFRLGTGQAVPDPASRAQAPGPPRCEKEPHTVVQSPVTLRPLNAPTTGQKSAAQRKSPA